MAARQGKQQSHSPRWRWAAVGMTLAVLLLCVVMVHVLEERMSAEIENAGMQLTPHVNTRNTAQVFMNDRWHAERNIESILVIGIDEYGSLTTQDAYNNGHQADFLMLFLRDRDTGRAAAIHLNRDAMTDITTLGVTGEPTGTRWAQLALSFNYGDGGAASSANVVSSTERLLYGVDINHYITVTMDAVPVLNDWAGGVTLEVLDDFSGVDGSLVRGQLLRLDGKQALAYVRSRKELDDTSNLRRMERQRQYASEWVKAALTRMTDEQSVIDLVMQLDDYYTSNCTVEELTEYARSLSSNPSLPVYEIEGKAVQGDAFMEFYVDETALQQLVLNLFYAPVE